MFVTSRAGNVSSLLNSRGNQDVHRLSSTKNRLESIDNFKHNLAVDEFPALTKSEPISFESASTRKPRRPSPTVHEPNPPSFVVKKKRSKRGQKSVSCSNNLEKGEYVAYHSNNPAVPPMPDTDLTIWTQQQLSLEAAYEATQLDVASSPSNSRTEDEGFMDGILLESVSSSSSSGQSVDATTPSLDSGLSSSSYSVKDYQATMPWMMARQISKHENPGLNTYSAQNFELFPPTVRARLDSLSEPNSTVGVFGSPDVNQAWSSTESARKSPASDFSTDTCSDDSVGEQQRQLEEQQHQQLVDDEEDEMEGTDLLHLISTSLDRFNAIVHPKDSSAPTDVSIVTTTQAPLVDQPLSNGGVIPVGPEEIDEEAPIEPLYWVARQQQQHQQQSKEESLSTSCPSRGLFPMPTSTMATMPCVPTSQLATTGSSDWGSSCTDPPHLRSIYDANRPAAPTPGHERRTMSMSSATSTSSAAASSSFFDAVPIGSTDGTDAPTFQSLPEAALNGETTRVSSINQMETLKAMTELISQSARLSRLQHQEEQQYPTAHSHESTQWSSDLLTSRLLSSLSSGPKNDNNSSTAIKSGVSQSDSNQLMQDIESVMRRLDWLSLDEKQMTGLPIRATGSTSISSPPGLSPSMHARNGAIGGERMDELSALLLLQQAAAATHAMSVDQQHSRPNATATTTQIGHKRMGLGADASNRLGASRRSVLSACFASDNLVSNNSPSWTGTSAPTDIPSRLGGSRSRFESTSSATDVHSVVSGGRGANQRRRPLAQGHEPVAASLSGSSTSALSYLLLANDNGPSMSASSGSTRGGSRVLPEILRNDRVSHRRHNASSSQSTTSIDRLTRPTPNGLPPRLVASANNTTNTSSASHHRLPPNPRSATMAVTASANTVSDRLSGPVTLASKLPVVAKWRRACSFYLRGHCKKEDCEFAHDLNKVTCKFWEVGECFKGSTCPFLHGYPPEMSASEDGDDSVDT